MQPVRETRKRAASFADLPNVASSTTAAGTSQAAERREPIRPTSSIELARFINDFLSSGA